MRGRVRRPRAAEILTAAVIVGTVGTVATAASAGTTNTGGGSADNGTITATASSGSTGTPGTDARGGVASGGTGGAAAVLPPTCTYVPAPAGAAGYLGPGEGGPGSWYVVNCPSQPTAAAVAFPVIWVPAPTPNAAPVRTPASSVPELARQAFGSARLVRPRIGLDPPGRTAQIVSVPTWLWVDPSDWHPVVASAAAGDVTATVTAAPISVTWTFGDGQTLRCAGPGVPYRAGLPPASQSTDCSHVWAASSAGQPGGTFAITASIQYSVTVDVIGAAGVAPDLGVHAGPPAVVQVAVSEVEALGNDMGSGLG